MTPRLIRNIAILLVLSLAAEPLGAAGAAFSPIGRPAVLAAHPAFQEQAVVPALDAAFRYLTSFNLRKSLEVIRDEIGAWRTGHIVHQLRDASGLLPGHFAMMRSQDNNPK